MKFSTPYQSFFEAFGIFCCGLILFTIGLKQQEVIGFESRFYLFAQEMLRNGVGWFPTAYGEYYPDYPVTSTWVIYIAAKLFGGLNKFSAVLPSALAAAVTLALTYRIGALVDKRYGLFAVFFLLLTNMFVVEARTISPDQYVAMVTAWSFYLVYSAEVFQRFKRLAFLPVLLVIGFAFRGPIGLIVPAGVVCIFYLVEKNYAYFFRAGCVAVLTLLICAAGLFAAAYHVGGALFMKEVLHMQISGRLQDASLPWYFYFYESLGAYALSYPLAVLAACGLLAARINTAQQKLFLQLSGWVLVILIGLTIPAGKKIRYVLAMVPALALMSASIFVFPQRATYFICLRKITSVLLICLPLVCLVIVCMLDYLVRFKTIVTAISFLPLMIGFYILLLLSLINRKREIVITGMAALTLLAAFIWVVEPINLTLNRTHQFVLQTENNRHAHHAALAFYVENPDTWPVKYVLNMPAAEQPIFITQKEDLFTPPQPAFIISDSGYFAALPPAISSKFAVIGAGQIGREDVLVLQQQN